jgi:hypothetical protein
MAKDVTTGAMNFRDKAPKARAKVLSHLQVSQAENGGHIVEHHFDNSGPGEGYHEAEQHVFGKGEGGKVLAHIGKHMGISGAAEEAGEAAHSKKGY